jgi:hypothetical protein
MSSPESAATDRLLIERLKAASQRFHFGCGGEVIGDACMRCGRSGEYWWATGSDNRPATTVKGFPIVQFVDGA